MQTGDSLHPFAPTAPTVPEQHVGSIMIWQGAADAVPDSWSLCDGTRGTPDLRDLFLMGNSVGSPPQEKGGVDSHDHDFTGDGHAHSLGSGSGVLSGVDLSASTTLDSVSGTVDARNSLPPYYSLCYIMFVGGD